MEYGTADDLLLGVATNMIILPFYSVKNEQAGSFCRVGAANKSGAAYQRIESSERVPQPGPELVPKSRYEPAQPASQASSSPKDRTARCHQNQAANPGSRQSQSLEQKVIHCPCGANLLFRWTWSTGSAMYRAFCCSCGEEHQVRATPPIELYHLDLQGKWEFVTMINSEST